MSNFTQDRIDQVWDKGEVIHGKNPDLYRMDKFGNIMYKHSYGKYTPMGWNIDHSKPQSKGGTDHLNNLQPMNSRANCSTSQTVYACSILVCFEIVYKSSQTVFAHPRNDERLPLIAKALRLFLLNPKVVEEVIFVPSYLY